MKNNDFVLSVENHELINKLYAHQKGIKHYAFSIFIFNGQGQLLLQKRAEHKYHSGGLWSNTCCSHPISSNAAAIKVSARDRLIEEMGLQCEIEYLFTLEYNKVCGELIENERDLVFVGSSSNKPIINAREVADFKWVGIKDVRKDIIFNPKGYTEWFVILIERHFEQLKKASMNLSKIK